MLKNLYHQYSTVISAIIDRALSSCESAETSPVRQIPIHFLLTELLAAVLSVKRLSPLLWGWFRWANVSYLDEKGKTCSEPGFFNERKSRLAKRNKLETTKVGGILVSELEPDSSGVVGLFQYMVGNADYSIVASADDACCHNAEILLQNITRRGFALQAGDLRLRFHRVS